MGIYDFKVKAQDGSDEKIYSFCTGRYGITFPQFSKVGVSGENADLIPAPTN